MNALLQAHLISLVSHFQKFRRRAFSLSETILSGSHKHGLSEDNGDTVGSKVRAALTELLFAAICAQHNVISKRPGHRRKKRVA